MRCTVATRDGHKREVQYEILTIALFAIAIWCLRATHRLQGGAWNAPLDIKVKLREGQAPGRSSSG